MGMDVYGRAPTSDRFWVWEGDLSRDICMAIYARLGWLAEPVSATPPS